MNNLEERRKRAAAISKKLKELFPDAKIALKYSNDWELLVAVILSAQCTDKKVNEVTKKLFQKYTTLEDYIKADPLEFEKDIFQTGFYHAKAKNILASANMIQNEFAGKIPCTMVEMLRLPGVARKTANIVLGNACGVVEGIAVDTHVRRLAIKLGLVEETKNTDLVERRLMEIFPKSEWHKVTYGLIEYGRNVCPRRKHDCAEHPLTKIYPKAAEIWP